MKLSHRLEFPAFDDTTEHDRNDGSRTQTAPLAKNHLAVFVIGIGNIILIQ